MAKRKRSNQFHSFTNMEVINQPSIDLKFPRLALASIGLENTEANRQVYRTLLVTVPISGATLFEETLYQSITDGKKMVDVLVEQNIVQG
ncbi:unnamed protein product [Dovyalis caffra]|uniref:fructose-bisphosphate aldolase n=1 Tax=Dovyalis caffra TaxID=77055 RepID=A0AAV1RGA0_9ROSI|nr:unnamed protein product [Dovyalis caffra]